MQNTASAGLSQDPETQTQAARKGTSVTTAGKGQDKESTKNKCMFLSLASGWPWCTPGSGAMGLAAEVQGSEQM